MARWSRALRPVQDRLPDNYPGAAPESNIVSIRTANANNESLVSDVVAGAQWVLANKDAYGIRVVNLSLLSGSPSSFVNDPLDQALEQLWFNGIVVVAASGNVGGPVRMDYAPANDPFIIVVGATETKNTSAASDDTVAAFSGYGRSYDGFARPDIVAPGRYMVAPAPIGSVLSPDLRGQSRLAGLPSPVGHVVRRSRRCRRRGADPRAPPRLDAGPGQGRPHADGKSGRGRNAAGCRGRR